MPNTAAAPIMYLQVTCRKKKATTGMMLRDNAQATVPELMTNPLSSVGKSSKPKVGNTIPGPWKNPPRNYFAWIFLLTPIMILPAYFFHPWFNILRKLSKILGYIDVFSRVLIICTIWRGHKILFCIKKSMVFKIFLDLFSEYL